MDKKSVWRELAELPPEAQRQVIDFIASLRVHYQQSASVTKSRSTDLTKETFVGMWKNREDLQNSSDWVRELRGREWITPSA